MAKRPVSAIGNKRPITEYARIAAAMGGHPRYKVYYWLISIKYNAKHCLDKKTFQMHITVMV